MNGLITHNNHPLYIIAHPAKNFKHFLAIFLQVRKYFSNAHITFHTSIYCIEKPYGHNPVSRPEGGIH